MSKESFGEKMAKITEQEASFSKSEENIIRIVCIGIFIATVIICFALGLESVMVVMLITFAATAIGAIVCMFSILGLRSPNEQENRDRLNCIVKYDASSECLTVSDRTKLLLERLSLVQAVDQQVKTEPVVLHFGAVAVGGVVTGGTYTTGGQPYIAAQGKSECFRLMYNGNNVKHIKLGSELLAIAKESEIKEYIDFDGIKVIAPIDTYSLSDVEKWQRLQEARAGIVRAKDVGYPSYEKAVAIVNWLTSEP